MMMKKSQVIDEINQLNEKLNSQLSSIQQNNYEVAQIEIDLILSTVRDLYDTLLNLNKVDVDSAPVNIQKNSAADELIAEAKSVEPSISKTVPVKNIINSKPESLTSSDAIKPDIKVEQKQHEEEVAQHELFSENEIKETVVSAQSGNTATLFDVAPSATKTQSPAPSVYEKISTDKKDNSLATKHQKNPVSDLKKSIGINEKFSFINELFDGDLNAYNDAIEKLNKSENHQSAIALLENDYSVNFGWDSEGESFYNLKTLVDRRFSM